MNTEYHKIHSVYMRDPETKRKTFLEGLWSRPEFGYLAKNDWIFTEKVDGTNIRIVWDGAARTIAGRTDNAQIYAPLYARLKDLFPNEKLRAQFGEQPAVLYGEGYGAKIQKGGGNYIANGVDFVLFDAFIGMWLSDIEELAEQLGVRRVPIVGVGTLYDAISLVREGFKSRWGDFEAEGIVARPVVELANRLGERVITKIKCRDFKKS
jgi:hypothetical protein